MRYAFLALAAAAIIGAVFAPWVLIFVVAGLLVLAVGGITKSGGR